jgi:hypothetical protein
MLKYLERNLLLKAERSGMNKILVPIKDFSALSMSASYFAIEFAKRTPQTKIFFLIFTRTNAKEIKRFPPPSVDSPWQKPFENLVQQALGDKMNLEIYYSTDDYVQAITRFVQDHHISEIIIALPADEDELSKEIRLDIQKLQGKVECQLVTVKPKEEGEAASSQRKNKPLI